jgi:hypothetical protein
MRVVVGQLLLLVKSYPVRLNGPYVPGDICAILLEGQLKRLPTDAVVEVVLTDTIGNILEYRFISVGANYPCCYTNIAYFIIPLRLLAEIPSLVPDGSDTIIDPITFFEFQTFSQLLVTEVKPAISYVSKSSISINSETDYEGQFIFVLGLSRQFTTTRYNYTTGTTQTNATGFYIDTTNSIITPRNKDQTSFTLQEACELYGIMPIYKSIQGTNFLQVNVLTAVMLTSLTKASSLPENTDISYGRACINSFLGDSARPMQYSGSMTSVTQMVCYSVRVASLCIPNQVLDLPNGGLTSSYSYMFFELTNETASSSHNRNVIYSNNPNSVFATFMCPISDINSPLLTRFLKIFSAGNQIIKFRPNDDLKIRLFMPDGLTFNTNIRDYLPPVIPNPLLQISVLLEINRL